MTFQQFVVVAVLASALAVPEASAGQRTNGPRSEGGRSAPRDGRSRGSGDVVIQPTVVGTPVNVGGIQVGEPVTVGAPIVIGHSRAATGPLQRQTGVALRPSAGAVLVAVPTVLIGVAPVVPGGAAFPGERVSSEERQETRTTSQGTARMSRAQSSVAVRFRPWYALTSRFTAGFPLAYLEPRARDASATGPAPAPRAGTHGGLVFDVNPAEASVFVDGSYVGVVADHAAQDTPLSLTPGWHEVEIRDTSGEKERFNVHLLLGQVVPVKGALTR